MQTAFTTALPFFRTEKLKRLYPKYIYSYLNYDVSEETIKKKQEVKQDNFFQWDGLYQYKDIVNMKIDKGKIRTICPCCHQG